MHHCSSAISNNSATTHQPRPQTKTPPPTGPITVYFVVHCRSIKPHELVFVTGNLERLGKWQPDGAIELVQDRQDESLWRTKIELPGEETRDLLKFRYFTGFYLQAGADPSPKIRIISRWESQRAARAVLPSVEADSTNTCRLKHIDEFGVYGGREIVSDGWLNHQGQNEILLRLHSNALKFFKPRHINRTYYIKVTPFDLRHKEDYAPYSGRGGIKSLWRLASFYVSSVDDEDGETAIPLPVLPSFSPTDLAILSGDDPSFYDQKSFGALFQNDQDYFIYRTQTVAIEFLAFRIEFFAEKKPSTEKASSSSDPRSNESIDSTENSSLSTSILSDLNECQESKITDAIRPNAGAAKGTNLEEINGKTKSGTLKNGLLPSAKDQKKSKTHAKVGFKMSQEEQQADKSAAQAKDQVDFHENHAIRSISLTPNQQPVPLNLERVAMCYVMPSSMPDTFGQLMVPILSKTNQIPIGQLTIDYLSTKTLSVQPRVPLTMETSFSRYWKKRKTVEVGHRGCGVSYTKFSSVRENTLHSLNHAAKNGADFVEFDVQLTKDLVPIIFHDFHVLIRVAKRSNSEHSPPATLNNNQLNPNSALNAKSPSGEPTQPLFARQHNLHADFHEIAVKDLKLQQLQLLHLEHYQAPEHADKLPLTGDTHEPDEFKPFPTLVDGLERVHPEVGFNIEVKFPMLMKDGTHECANYFERNEFIDLILKDVIEHSNGRRILFSSFEPDICYMIARKQNLYPVLFLCVGSTTRYVPFLDKRSSTSMTAVNFAVNSHILGVNFHSEELLRDRVPVERAKHFDLVSFVWGDDLDTPDNAEYFRSELNVNGIIYDKIGEIEKRQNCFVVEREVKSILFSPAASLSPSRRSSVDDQSSLPSVATIPLLNPGQKYLTKEELGSTEALLLADVRPKSPMLSMTPTRLGSPANSLPGSPIGDGSTGSEEIQKIE